MIKRKERKKSNVFLALSDHIGFSGFNCGNKQFKCKNGECVKINLRCDGDFACTDDSDEDNCECPSNKFACLDGKCLPASAVCNGISDCSNGDDENNCRE